MSHATDAQTVLLHACDQRLAAYLRQVQCCQSGCSEVAVHDLRVAIRRLLALVELLRQVVPHPRLGKVRRALKAQLKGFSALRDTQVMQAALDREFDQPLILMHVLPWLAGREARLQGRVARHVSRLDTARIERRLAAVRQRLAAGDGGQALAGVALMEADRRYADVQRRVQQLDPAHRGSIHRLRVAFKRFRYTVEIIRPLVPGHPLRLLDSMDDYQTLMGRIQDAVVMRSTFQAGRCRLPAAGRAGLLHWCQDREAAHVHRFLLQREQWQAFWRPQPDRAFPWRVRRGAPA